MYKETYNYDDDDYGIIYAFILYFVPTKIDTLHNTYVLLSKVKKRYIPLFFLLFPYAGKL